LKREGDFNNAALEAEQALTLPERGNTDAEIHFLLARLYGIFPLLANAPVGSLARALVHAQRLFSPETRIFEARSYR
jgi:hypothetical protein